MTDKMIEAIKSILHDRHCRSTTTSSLQLEDKQAGMKVQLEELPRTALLINVPAEGRAHLGMITNTASGLGQSCDYLLLIDREEHVDAYFIEMKKTFMANEDGVSQAPAEQILHTTPAFAYLVSMAKVHCGESKKTKLHFTIITQTIGESLRKQGVKYSSPFRAFPYRNEQFKVISSLEAIPLRML